MIRLQELELVFGHTDAWTDGGTDGWTHRRDVANSILDFEMLSWDIIFVPFSEKVSGNLMYTLRCCIEILMDIWGKPILSIICE